jgi:DNA topoisomerase-2
MNRESTVSKKYQKKSHLEHIKERPDTYIGSCQTRSESMWVFCAATNRMEFREIKYVPGLYKIFDEILVNAADNKQRDSSMKAIRVTVTPDRITVENDGRGIPIVMHETEKMWVPQLVFGELLSGDNYDDDDDRVVGGRNGYGAKLANIFSSTFCVETIDSTSGKLYAQTWHNNMSRVETPTIRSAGKRKDFTRISFAPDLSKFGLQQIDADTMALFQKRVYDIAGTTAADVRVYFNGHRLPVQNFKQYCSLYFQDETKIAYEQLNERWEVCVTVSHDQQPQQVSFCNSICTTKGGEHVKCVLDNIAKHVLSHRSFKELTVKASNLRNSTFVFVNALVTNPSFDSQTKETLMTRQSQFGPARFKPCISEQFANAIIKRSGIVEEMLFFARAKSQRQLQRKTSSNKTSRLIGVPKLDDATRAGSRRSGECTLILTEGDSAKALAIAGLSVIGRDCFGVFPLKGKLLNVRAASNQAVMQNAEIQNIMKIMGLNIGKTYTDVSSLRYGHIMIMTDQDHDGSHIKGLIINFLHLFWPSLLQIPHFLQVFITPIVKCTKGTHSKKFYTTPEYEQFAQSVELTQWKVKYYKGLGTSNAAEAKEYFSNLHSNRIPFQTLDTSCSTLIDMCFNKSMVAQRKQWISSYNCQTYMDFTVKEMSYTDFVNKEYIIMAVQDNLRSLPHVMDGLKPSQRKILFACLKRNLKDEIKVAQLAGYTSEHAAYHHGEASLHGAIINMAQNYVGSNNINLLEPNGQFGTRLIGGKDAASPRYVFTQLAPLTEMIFHPSDAPLYQYLEDDGQSIEPAYYLPVIPMVLINGSVGIGTGWSSNIPPHNPCDLVQYLTARLENKKVPALKPWYRGFTGTVTPTDTCFMMRGCWTWSAASCLQITELPVGTWTTPYKDFLEKAVDGQATAFSKGMIVKVESNHTDTAVAFSITLSPAFADTLRNDQDTLVKMFKLQKKIDINNMHAFDAQGNIKKYQSALEIIEEFYEQRLTLYKQRKHHWNKQLQLKLHRLTQKIQFLRLVVDGIFTFKGLNKQQLLTQLEQRGLHDADYLLTMSMWNMTDEKIVEHCQQEQKYRAEIQQLGQTSAAQLWLHDLKQIEHKLYQTKTLAITTPLKKKQRK